MENIEVDIRSRWLTDTRLAVRYLSQVWPQHFRNSPFIKLTNKLGNRLFLLNFKLRFSLFNLQVGLAKTKVVHKKQYFQIPIICIFEKIRMYL